MILRKRNKNTDTSLNTIQNIFEGSSGFANNLGIPEVVDRMGQEQRPVQQGRSYLFNGSTDYAVSGTSTTFETATNQFSMICDLQLIGAGGIVFNKASAFGGYKSYFFRYVSVDTMQLYFDNGVNWVGFNLPVANLATELNRIVARWSNITATASDCRAWVNGTEVSVTIGTSSGGFNSGFNISYLTTAPLCIGVNMNELGALGAPYLSGSLANLFAWNTALSVSDCIRLSDRTKPILQLPNIANLMFGYKCDEGDGTLGINTLGLGGNTNLTLNNIVPATFHQQRTDGFGADWQNQFGFTPIVRFNGLTNASGINLGNGANAQIVQHQAFTFHTWINIPSATGKAILSNYFNVGNGTQFQFGTAGTNITLFIPNIGYVYNGADNIVANTWFHIAWVRENTGTDGCKMYVNGNFRGRFTYANTVIPTSVMYIGTDILNAVGFTFDGRMQNICFVPSAVWTEGGSTTIGTNVFTPPTTWADYQNLEATNPSKLAIYTQNIVNNPLNLPITFVDITSLLIPRNENNPIDDALGRPLFYRNRAKYNAQLRQSNCLTFDGTNDFVTLPSVDIAASDNFIIEGNFMLATIAQFQNIISYRDIKIYYNNGTGFLYGVNGLTGTPNIFAPQDNVWYRYRIQRQAGDITYSINGIAMLTVAYANAFTGGFNNIGQSNDPLYLNGRYASHFMSINGTTIFDFPLQEGAGDRIFSRAGGHIGTLNNFAFPAAWANRQDVVHSNLIQGFDASVFFNGGTTQNLSLSDASFNIGTDDFTIDGWVYIKDTSNRGIFQLSSVAGGLDSTAGQPSIALGFAGTVVGLYRNGLTIITNTPPINQWIHFAVVRSGTTLRVYLNNVQISTETSSTNFTYTNLVVGGYFATNTLWNGYISNFRMFVGRALWTTGGYALPTTEADYSAEIANRVLFLRGLNDRNTNPKTITNNGTTLQVYKPITATNPQTQSNYNQTWHNEAETLFRQYQAPEVITRDSANYMFTGGGASNNLPYSTILSNRSSKIKANTSQDISNRRKATFKLKK
jgi:hypothetical protein